MLRTVAIAFFALLAPVLFSCEKVPSVTTDTNQEEQQQDNGNNTGSLKPTGSTLVVYYSFTGNCRAIVNALTASIKADVLEILPAEEGLDYAADNYAIGSSLIAAIREKPDDAASYPAIKPVNRNAADYDTIIIVTPLWWSNMAAIMQSYLFREGAKMKDKTIGLIVSSASSGISSVVADAKRLIPEGRFLAKSLWINSSNRGQQDTLIKEWAEASFNNKDTMPDHINITVSGKTLPVAIVDNNATKALVAALREAPISYEASD